VIGLQDPSGAFVISGIPVYVRPKDDPVEALAVVHGRVAAFGTFRDVAAQVGGSVPSHVIEGGAILPAFVDAHQHAFLVAMDPFSDVLHSSARDIAELLTLVARFVAEPTDQPWVRLHGYEPLRLRERRSPTAAELDEACSERPLHVISRTFHESAVNSLGLAAMGVTRQTPDPAGGRIVRDRRGQPTGVLLEAASFAAEQISRPEFDRAAVGARLETYLRIITSMGIARIGDAAVPADLANWYIETAAGHGVDVHPLLVGSRIDEPAFRAGGTAKVLADGGEYCHLCMSGSQTARVFAASTRAMLGPDADVARAVGNRSGWPHRESDRRWHMGIRFPEEARLASTLEEAARAGSGVAVHAVGNGAVEMLLDAQATGVSREDPLRLRIEHAMVLDPGLIARIAESASPVVAQPAFLSAFGHDLEVVPVPRPLMLMPFRSMLDRGVELVFSSDFPAAHLSPWWGIADAITRSDGRGGVIHPEESVSVAEALHAYTEAAARAIGVDEAGSLEVGKRADLQWVSADPFRTVDLRSIQTRALWRDGRLIYEG
jgi:predicted amidohydrolase YtcJ